MADKFTFPGNSTYISNKFINRGRYIGLQATKIYITLKKHTNQEEYETTGKYHCFPSYSTLQKETGLSDKQISRAITELKFLGYIQYIEKGYNRVNHYYLGEIENDQEFKKCWLLFQEHKHKETLKVRERLPYKTSIGEKFGEYVVENFSKKK